MTGTGVEVRPAGAKGLGVFAARAFAAGEVILRFAGRVVQRHELPSLTSWEREHLGELGPETYQVLPAPRCYLNHACDPNAVSSADTLYARRRIEVAEEITLDYRVNAHEEPAWLMDCYCEGEPPHEVVGDFFELPAERQAEYLPYAPAFIREEHARRSAGAGTSATTHHS